MIVQVRLKLQEGPHQVQATLAYPLYAWLLSQIPESAGDQLHEPGTRAVSQHLWRDPQTGEPWWIVTLLNDETVQLFLPILETRDQARLHQGFLPFASRQVERLDDAHALVQRAQQLPQTERFALELVTPTAFKQEGRYAIFPQESLVLHSLVSRWELSFPDVPLSDPDAMQALQRGLHIVDYRLQTLRHSLKQTRIPSFVGRIVLEARLPAPLMEVFKTLYCFAPYAGMGIKTALGMGGVHVPQQETDHNG